MKRIILILLILQSSICFAEEEKIVDLNINLSDFKIGLSENEGEHIITSNKYMLSYPSNLESPAIPFLYVNIFLDSEKEYHRLDILKERNLVRNNIIISNSPEYFTKGEKTYEKGTKSIDKEYKQETVTFVGIQVVGEGQVLTFKVSPFYYDQINKDLYFEKNIKLKLYTSLSVNRNNSGCKRNNLDIIKNIVINGKDVEKNNNEVPDISRVQSTQNTPYKYIIITNEEQKPAYEKLAKWKTQKGVKAKVLTTSEITSNYLVGDLQERIKTAIYDQYVSSNNELTYVLLGGDSEIVPARMCYIKYQYYKNNSWVVYQESTPSDLYYGCFSNIKWDDNNNGIYGEIEDNINLIPDVFVTRLPSCSYSDANTMVNRILSYEKNPIGDCWNDTILMSGRVMGGYYNINGTNISDTQYKSDSLYTTYIQPNWNGGKKSFYDTYTDFEGGANYDFNANHLQEHLSKGYRFFHVETHGMPTYWVTEATPYSTNYADILQNNGSTFLLTSACHTNAFDYSEPCLSEAFLRNVNSGIFAYVGSSRQSWYCPGKAYQGPSNKLNGEILKILFSKIQHNYGKIVAAAKNNFVSNSYTYTDMYRWLLFSVNPLGDPEMQIYDTMPLSFSDITLSYKNDTLRINTNIDHCRICLMGEEGNEDYEIIENSNSAIFANLTGKHYLCITKPGYIPYCIQISDNLYIQNETISSDTNYIANKVLIGSDVTNQIQQGPVNIIQGNVTIENCTEVMIQGEFEVNEGATFVIKNH